MASLVSGNGGNGESSSSNGKSNNSGVDPTATAGEPKDDSNTSEFLTQELISERKIFEELYQVYEVGDDPKGHSSKGISCTGACCVNGKINEVCVTSRSRRDTGGTRDSLRTGKNIKSVLKKEQTGQANALMAETIGMSDVDAWFIDGPNPNRPKNSFGVASAFAKVVVGNLYTPPQTRCGGCATPTKVWPNGRPPWSLDGPGEKFGCCRTFVGHSTKHTTFGTMNNKNKIKYYKDGGPPCTAREELMSRICPTCANDAPAADVIKCGTAYCFVDCEITKFKQIDGIDYDTQRFELKKYKNTGHFNCQCSEQCQDGDGKQAAMVISDSCHACKQCAREQDLYGEFGLLAQKGCKSEGCEKLKFRGEPNESWNYCLSCLTSGGEIPFDPDAHDLPSVLNLPAGTPFNPSAKEFRILLHKHIQDA